MVRYFKQSSSFSDWSAASVVLSELRRFGRLSAIEALRCALANGDSGPLLNELEQRLVYQQAPRIIFDAIWLVNQYGGISRVWNHIIDTLSLPGLISASMPVAFINRSSHPLLSDFTCFEGASVSPFETDKLSSVSDENSYFCNLWNADVFCSSWITTSSSSFPVCSELALVHDCLPERLTPIDPRLSPLRQRWLHGASSHICVSHATSIDVSRFTRSSVNAPWTHLAPSQNFTRNPSHDSWISLKSKFNLPDTFIVLPSVASLGTYKNPDVLLEALAHPSLEHISLVITGSPSCNYCNQFRKSFPSLKNRIFQGSFSDSELSTLYFKSLCVVVPSLLEGFGLPSLEVLASSGILLVSDVPGLRESASEAALVFPPTDSTFLVYLIQAVANVSFGPCLRSVLSRRSVIRLSRLNQDLFALSLLCEARRLLSPNPHYVY